MKFKAGSRKRPMLKNSIFPLFLQQTFDILNFLHSTTFRTTQSLKTPVRGAKLGPPDAVSLKINFKMLAFFYFLLLVTELCILETYYQFNYDKLEPISKKSI